MMGARVVTDAVAGETLLNRFVTKAFNVAADGAPTAARQREITEATDETRRVAHRLRLFLIQRVEAAPVEYAAVQRLERAYLAAAMALVAAQSVAKAAAALVTREVMEAVVCPAAADPAAKADAARKLEAAARVVREAPGVAEVLREAGAAESGRGDD